MSSCCITVIHSNTLFEVAVYYPYFTRMRWSDSEEQIAKDERHNKEGKRNHVNMQN